MAAKTKKQDKSSKSKNSLRVIDIVVIVLCLAGAVVSLNLFRIDLFQTVRNLNAVPLGLISFKYNTAQRRLEDRVLWDRLRQDSHIYDGDTIRTADLSEAVIRFGGGREINLTENTLIQIRMRDGLTEIDLSDGELSLGAGSGDAQDSIVLSVGDTRIEAGSDAVLNAAAGAGGVAIQVSQGNAVYSGSGGQRRTVAAGTAVSLTSNSAGGSTDSNKPAAVVSAPLPNARFLALRKDPLPITFSWNRINLPASETLQLEIAENRSFSRIRQTISGTGSSVRAELPPGTWYWRIKRTTENTVLASNRLTVLYAPSPSLIAPTQGYTYQYRTKLPAVRFQWEKIEDASQYMVEVADNRNFTNPRIALKVKGTSLDSSNLEAGTWYWRVTPVVSGDSQGTAASSSASFKIQQSGTLAAPTLISPETRSTVNIGTNRDAYFSWKKESEAASYTIQVAQNRNMRNPVIKAEVKDNFFVSRQKDGILKAGQYYWAVFQTDTTGIQSSLSSVNSFTVSDGEPAQRPLFPPDNYVIAETLLPDIRFTWKSGSLSNSRFQISGSSDFSRLVIDERVLGESFRGRTLPAGTYYWRVSGNSADSAQQTQTRQFAVVSSLPAPVVEAPPSGGLVVVRTGEQFALRWRAVSRAEYYQVRIYPGTKISRRPMYEQNVTATTLQLPANTFATGAYYWTIQAFADERSNATRLAGLTGEEQFSVRRLQPLTLDWPEMDTEISGPVDVRWNTTETVGRSRLILSQNSNPSRGTPVREILNPGRSLTLDLLTEGLYYWTVIAETPEGYDISSTSPRRFRVLPYILPEPAGLSPVNDWVAGPDELRASRNIVFSWDAVENADAYLFTLFRETGAGRQQIIRTETLQQPSWTLNDLQLLGEGDFVWQLEAVRQGRNGSIAGRGHVVESRFRLDIPLPDQVQVIETGILYGN